MNHYFSKAESMITLISGSGFLGLFYIGFFIGKWLGTILILISLIFGAASVFILIGLIIHSIKYKVYSQKRIINIGIVGLTLFTVVFRPIEWITEEIKSPVIFAGSCEHTVTSVWIILRQDKTFEYNAGAFLDREMYSGKYEISDSLIVLDFEKNENLNTNDTLIITNKGLEELKLKMTHHHIFKGEINNLVFIFQIHSLILPE